MIDSLIGRLGEAKLRVSRIDLKALALARGTPIYLAGRFAFLPGAEERAREQFPFDVRWPSPRQCWASDFPWQAHLASLGLVSKAEWRPRLTAPQAGDVRVAA
jgi:hypothetical protein